MLLSSVTSNEVKFSKFKIDKSSTSLPKLIVFLLSLDWSLKISSWSLLINLYKC